MYTRQTPVAASRQWLETLLLAAVGVSALAFYRYQAHNPDVDVSAGWLVLVPVLSGAQHGTLFGFGSAGAICSVGLLASMLDASIGDMGSLIAQRWGLVFAGVGSIAGFFRDLDERRYAQLSQRARTSAEDLLTLEHAFACLQYSHAQLEQQFCTQPHSLRSILEATSERMRVLRSSGALAELILEVIVSRTPVQSASVFALGPSNHVDAQAVASLNKTSAAAANAARLDVANHPLVQRALCSTGLVSIVDATARARAPAGVVAAVALQSSCARLRLLFVVHQLPFEAFCVEELRNLHILLARLIDLAQQRLDALDEAALATAPKAASSPWYAKAAVGGRYSIPDGRRAEERPASLRSLHDQPQRR